MQKPNGQNFSHNLKLKKLKRKKKTQIKNRLFALFRSFSILKSNQNFDSIETIKINRTKKTNIDL